MNGALSDRQMMRQNELADRMRQATETRMGWTFDFRQRTGHESRRWHFFSGTNTSVCGRLTIEADAPLASREARPQSEVCAFCLQAMDRAQMELRL